MTKAFIGSITVSTPQPRNRAAIIGGYLRAVERFRLAENQCNADMDNQLSHQEIGYSSLYESVLWARTFVDGLSRAEKLALDSDLAFSFIFPRNELAHSWNELMDIEISDGKHTWMWSTKDLEVSKRNKKSYAKYQEFLAGRIITETLDEFAEILWSIRRWEITQKAIAQPGVPVLSKITFDQERS
jgi:hypothetical protein